ncbi:GNAT family N-acetyltransferase [Tuanshanicoccus lijuaniae]|uniref:GNAT family N-acetyltransferase n=1 Tax=Aerococcaceae bacterium zg-1292 TaxID=2774330 RepID=UPI001936B80D|nr:GNAT family N-acetyltransferase [Aerococcaceae bacterium zg-1292]QQA36484.1 GNAT family N-acetyltransferase [Aerococcaceae bacterium zg-1292]
MKIIPYDDKYKNQLLAMVSQARMAIGLSATVRSDLYDIQANYFDKGDMFWIAVDGNNTLIGCIGYSRINNQDEAFLHRFYIRALNKHQGIGTALLNVAEKTMKNRGINISRVHLGEPKEKWFESYSFYPKNGYVEHESRYMMKKL